MWTSKDAELNTAVLHFLAKCLTEGDYQSLADLGINRHDADAVAQLYLSDIEHVVSVHFPLLRNGAIDRDLLHRPLAHVQQLREIQSARDELLRLDAPFPMMREYLGMDATEYAECGRRLEVPATAAGRVNRPKPNRSRSGKCLQQSRTIRR